MSAAKKLAPALQSPSALVECLAADLAQGMLALPWKEKEVYLAWVTQHYHLVRRTMRYINLAAGLSDISDEKTYHYWMHHLKEELNHHRVLERDGEKFGLSLPSTEPWKETQALQAVIRQGMLDSDGYHLFGYGALLEGLAVHAAAKIADQVEAAHGPGSAKFLRLHADVDDGDDGHYLKMGRHMDALPLERQTQIREAAEMNHFLYSALIRRLQGIGATKR